MSLAFARLAAALHGSHAPLLLLRGPLRTFSATPCARVERGKDFLRQNPINPLVQEDLDVVVEGDEELPATEGAQAEEGAEEVQAAGSGAYVNPQTGEIGGPRGPEPTRYGDWERKGRVSDF